MYKTNQVKIVPIKKRGSLEEIIIDLPRDTFPILSHLENLRYCLNRINEYTNGEIPVIGYNKLNIAGIINIDHRLLSLKEAIELKSKNKRFDYVTKEKILEELKKVNNNEYLIENGLIIGPKEY